jgi:hypothetical protein
MDKDRLGCYLLGNGMHQHKPGGIGNALHCTGLASTCACRLLRLGRNGKYYVGGRILAVCDVM